MMQVIQKSHRSIIQKGKSHPIRSKTTNQWLNIQNILQKQQTQVIRRDSHEICSSAKQPDSYQNGIIYSSVLYAPNAEFRSPDAVTTLMLVFDKSIWV